MQGTISVGHPVDVASGVFYTAAHDVVIPGLIPIIWRRCYSTGLLTRAEPSAMGAGWVHYFDMSLRRVAGGYELFGHDGQSVPFSDVSPLNAAAQMEIRREGSRLAVYHWHGWDGEVKKLMFDPPEKLDEVRPLAAIETPAGYELRLEHDLSGRLMSVRQGVEGRGIDLLYNPDGTITRILASSPIGSPVQLVEYAYSASPTPRLVAALPAGRAAQRYAYSNQGLMIQEVGHGGGAFYMKYDSASRCVEVHGENDYQLRWLSFDPARRVTRVVDSLGHATSYLANERGQIERIRYPDGGERSRVFDADARIVEEHDPMGLVIRHEYDGRGNRVATTRSGGERQAWTFNDAHQVTAWIQADESRWTFAYDSGGRMTAIVRPDGVASRMSYDEQGVLTESRDAGAMSIRVSHAPDWSSETFEDDFGLVLRRTYDPWLRTLREEDAGGMIFQQELDASGRVVSKTLADGAKIRFTWNDAGDPLEIVNAEGNRTRIEYTAYGQATRLTDPNGLVYQFESDREGRVTALINPKRERASFEHDSMGRVIRQAGFDGQVQRWEYDLAGRLVRRVKPGGLILDFEVDDAGRLLRILSSGRELAGWRYDAIGNVIEARSPGSTISVEWDQGRRLIAETQNDRRVSYTRTPRGGLTQLALAGAPGTLEFDCDERGRVTAMRAGGEVAQTFRYTSTDSLAERNFGAWRELTSYDGRRRIQGLLVADSEKTRRLGQLYGYDRSASLTRVTDAEFGTHQYRYDAGKRLIGSTDARGGEREFEYDDCGNLLDQGDLGISYGPGGVLGRLGDLRFENDEAGRAVRVTDARGHLTSYVWDELDQLVEVKRGETLVRYAYDALGRRISKTVDGQETRFYWAGSHLLGEESSDDATLYWSPGLVPLFSWSLKDGKRHIVTAPNGVPMAVVNPEANSISRVATTEFGGTISDGAVPFRLMGQYEDEETGLHYNMNRYYLPMAGRFLTQDPIGFAGQLNLYGYAPNAIGFADPLGLICGNTGCGQYAVYALKAPNGDVGYVGITMQDPQKRCNQHTYGGKVFTTMDIIADSNAVGGPMTKQQARNLEGSCLYNVSSNSHSAVSPYPVSTSAPMQNAQKINGGYYHEYKPTTPGYIQPQTTQLYLMNTVGQYQ